MRFLIQTRVVFNTAPIKQTASKSSCWMMHFIESARVDASGVSLQHKHSLGWLSVVVEQFSHLHHSKVPKCPMRSSSLLLDSFVARLELSSLELCSGSKQYGVIENCSAHAILEFWQRNDVKNLPWDILQINMAASAFFKLHFDGLAFERLEGIYQLYTPETFKEDQ